MFCILQGILLEAAEAEDTLNVVDRAQENHSDATDIPEVHYACAGEIPWCETYPPTEPSEITMITGETKVATEKVKLEFVERKVTVDERRLDMESRQMTLPVNRHSFSGGRSDVRPDFSAYVPARQIAENLGLTNRPQTYDLFDSDGRLASLAGRHGGEASNMQEFVFIRKDLLDHYLAESGQRLAWVIYGERVLYGGGMGGAKAFLGDASPYVRYEKTRLYY